MVTDASIKNWLAGELLNALEDVHSWPEEMRRGVSAESLEALAKHLGSSLPQTCEARIAELEDAIFRVEGERDTLNDNLVNVAEENAKLAARCAVLTEALEAGIAGCRLKRWDALANAMEEALSDPAPRVKALLEVARLGIAAANWIPRGLYAEINEMKDMLGLPDRGEPMDDPLAALDTGGDDAES